MSFKLDGTKFKAWTDAGAPLVGGLLYTYSSGTTTNKATYTDSTLGSANTNPVVLDARGEADVWLGSGAYTFVLKTAAGVTLDTVDGVVDPQAAAESAIRGDLASTASGKGAALVGMEGGGTVAQALKFLVYAASGGDDTTAIQALDTAAAAAGLALVISGQITVSSAVTFAARVVPGWGAKITTSGAGGGTKWLKFAAGCDAQPGQFWLDTDWPTQFLAIDRIYPQWFGATGLNADDQSTALIRSFRACRASAASATSHPGADYGCRTVHFTSGVYRGNDIPVYCGTIITGDGQGSLYGATLTQIDHLKPLLRVVPKNYALNDAVLNDSVGQNFFRHVGLRSEVASSATEGLPIVYFMSAAQATTYLAIAGDSTPASPVGHIDTMFQDCWAKDGNTVIMADEGMLWVHLRGCTFDVCRRAVQHKGTAYGMVRSYDGIYYAMTWGAFDNTSGDSTTGVRWESHGDEFKAGNTANANAEYRRALNYNPSAYVAGTFVRVKGSHFLRTDQSGSRFGGPIFCKNVETVDIDCRMLDPDSTNNQKAVAVQDNVRHLSIRGDIITSDLASHTNSRIISITQSTQTLSDCHISANITNTNGTAVATAIHADFALTNVDLSGTVVRGAFTTLVDSLYTRPYGWIFTGGKTYDPPSISAGGTTTTAVTVTGAQLGDTAEAVFSLSLGGLVLTSYVSAADTVTCVFFNPTAGAIDLASGTLAVSTQRRG